MADTVVQLCTKWQALTAESDALNSQVFELTEGGAESAAAEGEMESVNTQCDSLLAEIVGTRAVSPLGVSGKLGAVLYYLQSEDMFGLSPILHSAVADLEALDRTDSA